MSIIFDHVNYIYNPGTAFEKAALKDISLTICDGEFIGLIGHTGSGKSTLIQHMNGLIKPSSGSIYYDLKDISDGSMPLRELRNKVGLVFQYPEHQLFEATVSKDVMFGPGNQGLDNLTKEMRSFEALKSVGIDESLLDVSPFDLSGGQKRRVAIAGVLAMRPSCLVLDEPAAGLDPAGRREILDLISKIHREQGITVILVSHSMEDVAEYVDRIIVMNDGSIAMDGTPDDVFMHADELTSMGLDVPEVTRLFIRMKREGLVENTKVYTVGQAYEKLQHNTVK